MSGDSMTANHVEHEIGTFPGSPGTGAAASAVRREAHSMRASAQVTAPGAITSMIVAVSTSPNRQNRSTSSRMSLSTKAEVEAGKSDKSTGSAQPSPTSRPLGWSTPSRRQMATIGAEGGWGRPNPFSGTPYGTGYSWAGPKR